MRRASCRRLAVGALLLSMGLGGLASSTPEAHQPIASRWTYTEDVFPLLQEHCGRCHVEGGIAPFSLLEYRQAYPWSQAIREEVSALTMPPWRAEDGFGTFRNGHALPADAMDKILEWASGGYPEGPRELAPTATKVDAGWPLGDPDLVLPMPEAFTLAADTEQAVRYFAVPTGLSEARWIRGLDVRPGARAVVRNVAVYLDAEGRALELDAAEPGSGFTPAAGPLGPGSVPLLVWSPDQTSVWFGGSAAHRIPEGAGLVLRVDYRKTWITTGQAFTDTSEVGLYFTDQPAQNIVSLLLAPTAPPVGRELTVTRSIDRPMAVLGVLPEVGLPASDVRVEAVLPDETRVPMLWLREPDGQWPKRYWFDEPIDLPKGSRLEATLTLRPGTSAGTSPGIAPGMALLPGDGTALLRVALAYVDAS